jgi:hypothetical protein
MSESNRRIFSRANPQAGTLQWFFKSSEGPMGPYESEEEAAIMLGAFIDSWQREGRISDTFVPSMIPSPKLGALIGEVRYAA